MKKEPVNEQLPSRIYHAAPTAWPEARRRLAGDSTARWPAVCDAMLLLVVWLDDALCFVAGAATRKGKNFAHNPLLIVCLWAGDIICSL